jgi:hypothetical protein
LKSILTGLLLALVATLGIGLAPNSARADEDWCADDPLVAIQGKVVDIEVGIPLAHIKDLTGPAVVNVYVPSNVSANVLLTTGLLYPITVNVIHTKSPWTPGTPVKVNVQTYVPASSAFNVDLLVFHTSLTKVIDLSLQKSLTNHWFGGSFALAGLL